MSYRARLGEQSGTSAGTVIIVVSGFCIACWIFFAVVDWIVATKEDRWARREAQGAAGIYKPHKVQERPSTQITY